MAKRDGFKMNNLTAAAAVSRDVSKSLRVSTQASILIHIKIFKILEVSTKDTGVCRRRPESDEVRSLGSVDADFSLH